MPLLEEPTQVVCPVCYGRGCKCDDKPPVKGVYHLPVREVCPDCVGGGKSDDDRGN